MKDPAALRRDAHEIFRRTLDALDAGRAVRETVHVQNSTLRVLDTEFDLREHHLKIYSVALGKAAAVMAYALDEALGDCLTSGVISTTTIARLTLPERWRVFAGGHPLPNGESVEAARNAFELLRNADSPSSLVIFLVSGGGSAMLELPSDARVSLADLREANRVLVSCGATIKEVNAVRRALSAVKGGGLSACARRAAQISLIVSDTQAGHAADVASGPTFEIEHDRASASSVRAKYNLTPRLPVSILRALEESVAQQREGLAASALRRHYVLLDNVRALEIAAAEARELGYEVEIARELVEQHVEEGSAEMVSRLVNLYRRKGTERSGVSLISGGEFSCPVRGHGVGGRNSETALRCAIELERLARGASGDECPEHIVALCAGTDGIDGNSPAAGALADQTTIRRGVEKGLNARRYLDESDAYTFFDALGDAILTGPTGTNVRDLRIMLAA
ncbi:MAG: DUF4147 domain-containing protein [Acidobacteria bacterium]|nr:DUF4147 domain-containing protein [Acidobacteriota bacterium]